MAEAKIITSQYELEKRLYDTLFALCRDEYVKIMQEMDDWIYDHRDQSFFEYVSSAPVRIKTLFGKIEYERRLYKYKNLNGKREAVYLLDELFNFEKIGNFSLVLAEQITQQLEQTGRGKDLVKEIQEKYDVEVSRQSIYVLAKKYKAYAQEKMGSAANTDKEEMQ